MADLDQRDADIREQLPGLWLLASLYSAPTCGLDRIPAKVGTDRRQPQRRQRAAGHVRVHAGVLLLLRRGAAVYQLAHNLVVSAPPLGWLRKFGTVAANPENARLALESGAALLVYPGGDYEVFRPSWERNVVDFGGRKGYVRLARDAGVPIVPVASVGGQETALFLDRGQWLAKLLMVDKLLRLKSVPISLALPWGLNISDLAGHIPLPAKITIEVQEPIDVEDIEAADDDVIHDKVEASLQAGVDRLAAERRFPVIG
jgi:1-acyl-sn-glycerol-3-phosphate acyltransferase